MRLGLVFLEGWLDVRGDGGVRKAVCLCCSQCMCETNHAFTLGPMQSIHILHECIYALEDTVPAGIIMFMLEHVIVNKRQNQRKHVTRRTDVATVSNYRGPH